MEKKQLLAQIAKLEKELQETRDMAEKMPDYKVWGPKGEYHVNSFGNSI